MPTLLATINAAAAASMMAQACTTIIFSFSFFTIILWQLGKPTYVTDFFISNFSHYQLIPILMIPTSFPK